MASPPRYAPATLGLCMVIPTSESNRSILASRSDPSISMPSRTLSKSTAIYKMFEEKKQKLSIGEGSGKKEEKIFFFRISLHNWRGLAASRSAPASPSNTRRVAQHHPVCTDLQTKMYQSFLKKQSINQSIKRTKDFKSFNQPINP